MGSIPPSAPLFRQSDIKEHAELHLLLSMLTPVSWLERNPTYKEQMRELSERDLSTYGFLGYPVLQAADIIMYKAHRVPVGVDQAPHVELTREIVRRFNSFYGPVFPGARGAAHGNPAVAGAGRAQDEQELRQLGAAVGLRRRPSSASSAAW